MLKRQRPVSPQPSTPDIPFLDEQPPYHKRRRTLPPVLDGQARGWGVRIEDDVDGESDDESVTADGSDSPSIGDLPSQAAWEYKSANSLLHDLHAQHQHRLIFSSSSPHREFSFDQAHHYLSDLPSRQPISPPSRMTTPQQCAGNLLCHKYNVDMPLVAISPSRSTVITDNKDEIECVRERYEETNKLLGTLFLSRRRELGSIEGS